MNINIRTRRLMADLEAVVRDTEDLLTATAGDASERAARARVRAEESLHKARGRLRDLEREIAARAREAAQTANDYVHENPWPTIGVAAGVGFLFGLLIGRR